MIFHDHFSNNSVNSWVQYHFREPVSDHESKIQNIQELVRGFEIVISHLVSNHQKISTIVSMWSSVKIHSIASELWIQKIAMNVSKSMIHTIYSLPITWKILIVVCSYWIVMLVMIAMVVLDSRMLPVLFLISHIHKKNTSKNSLCWKNRVFQNKRSNSKIFIKVSI